ncbi:MAG: hypothetical protein AMJ69_03145 [Gammaproteobacteria bacterium SG8_47]|nr:MAG: hypothetical protein AMJ69_03145 [Gammaproteobacteria bacterium SG8_47]
MTRIPLDSDSEVVEEHYAVVFTPRRQRDRFSEQCVEIVESEESARELADPTNKRYAAKVIGPSRSSEGLRLYYLVEWL